MERKRESILNTLLKKKKKEKFSPFQLKNEHRDDDSTSAESPIKIKISQTKSMTEKEFETAVREHRRKMSKKYLTKQVSTFCLSNGNSELLYSDMSPRVTRLDIANHKDPPFGDVYIDNYFLASPSK